MSKLAIIDGDALTYHSSKESIYESIEIIDEKIQNIFIQTGATHYVLFISNSPYFRHKISPDYKSNRNKYKSPLKWLKTLKKYLIEEWGAQSMDLVEADDLCAYWMNKDLCIADDGKIEPREVFVDALDYCAVENLPQFEFESMEKVLCAVDKDLLQSIPGKHFNYTYKLEEKGNPDSVIKGSWVETLPEVADNFLKMQMIVGDTADGISGLKGKGIKYFEEVSKDRVVLFKTQLQDFIEKGKIVFSTKNLEETHYTYFIKNWVSTQGLNMQLNRTSPSWYEILMEYASHYKGNLGNAVYEFQKNFRQLYILQTDEDFIREIGVVPELPEIREVNFKPLIPEVDDDITF